MKWPSVVITVYRSRGVSSLDAMRALLEEHIALLLEKRYVTAKDKYILSSDDYFLEVFEWASEESLESAHGDEAVGVIWNKLHTTFEYATLHDLPVGKEQFAHFHSLSKST
jgi:hypothetical protein